ncbi:MAG: hypothetical protein Q4A31_07775 [Corynebacterium sp.]|uniref:hypothetical protein n=1 Tax=Corynebacterium sp. TaxID=1720 RepID=UPI0026DAA9A2|nr:hypothetical protein [Corynebacterium sp.]MDO4761801.1 hypothetical protein [Corynebacterium sp.]
MNLTALTTATRMAKKAYGSYADYRDRKANEAYEALIDAANSYNVKGFIDDSTQRFSTLSEKALKRIDDLKDDLHVGELEKVASEKVAHLSGVVEKKAKASKRVLRKKAKEAEKAAKKAARKDAKRSKWATFSLAAVIMAVIGGAVYFLFGLGQSRKPVRTAPPKVEDYETPDTDESLESVLVYSTETPTEGNEAAAAQDLEDDLFEALERDFAEDEKKADK